MLPKKDANSNCSGESILKLVFFDRGDLCYLFCFLTVLMIFIKAAVLKDFDKKIRLAALQTESTGFSLYSIHVCYFPLPRQFHTAIVEQ
jgi:hypothetical protein